ncbi:hypothetical protein OE88DRAFT_1666325 [Heliocybe sulcata]|uniref:Uncharacterized protein n=1 Tax=Heliocybe sulcata TaxID=5364 RepID=A0A5C3MP60_9AGAM|nr:hypothetical protein OE88DRAFT_1666325 [Heliocybe sulcata]
MMRLEHGSKSDCHYASMTGKLPCPQAFTAQRLGAIADAITGVCSEHPAAQTWSLASRPSQGKWPSRVFTLTRMGEYRKAVPAC